MSTPVLSNSIFLGDESNIRHVLYQSFLWRDWNYAETSLSGFSPFTSDGAALISTLFSESNPGGPWYDAGYLDAAGVDINQKLETKPTMVAQARWPARFDYTSETEEISTNLMESNPIVDALRDNHPLSTVQPIGTVNYSTAEPVERNIFFRQLLMIGIDGRSEEAYYVVRVYPKVLITDFGVTKWNAEDTAFLPVKIMAVPDPYTVPPDGVTVGSPRWIMRGGPGWIGQNALGGVVVTTWPSPQTAPVATAGASGAFTVVFAQPTSTNSPFSYTVSANNGTIGQITHPAVTASTSSGTVTLSGSGLISGDDYVFTVTATGVNGMSTASMPSNSITAE